ncbi:hypothetical protein ACFL0U_04445 [Pseudomonadota bacterium]
MKDDCELESGQHKRAGEGEEVVLITPRPDIRASQIGGDLSV